MVIIVLVCFLLVSWAGGSKEKVSDKEDVSSKEEIVDYSTVPSHEDSGTISVLFKATARTVYRIPASPKDGYYINAYLVVPKSRTLKHLLVHPVKIGDEQPYEESDKEVQELVKTKRYHGYRVDELASPVSLYLALPETDMAGGHRHLSLDKMALLGSDDFNHLDLQVCKIMDVALSYLREDLGIDLPDKVDMCGYSGEAEFIVRFALLHPQRLHAVCAGGMSWSPALPIAELYGSEIDYPLGVNDIKKYTDDFDLDAWKEIKFFLDMGMKDDRGCYNKEDLAKLHWTDGLEYQAIWFIFCDVYASLTDNAELVSYSFLNHSYLEKDYASFLLENDGDMFVKTTPTKNAIVITSEGREYCQYEDGDGSGLRARTSDGSFFSGCGNGTYYITYNGYPVSDYTYELSDPSYGNVQKNSNGTLTLHAEEQNATGSIVIVHYKGKTFTFQWYKPDK